MQMKTIKSNFTEGEDYKTSLLPKEKSSWSGSGSEQIMWIHLRTCVW